MEINDQVEMHFRKIPRHVHDHFKATCARLGTNMTAVLVRLMRDYIRENDRLSLSSKNHEAH